MKRIKNESTSMITKITRQNAVLKQTLIYTLSFLFGITAILVMLICTIFINNTKGKGGYESPSQIQLANDIAQSQAQAEEEIALEEKTEDTAQDITQNVTYFSYRVKKGDMIGLIAERFNVTEDSIISINNIRQSRLIQIGQYLKIPSMPGILYTVKTNKETPETIAEKYKVDAKECALTNNMEINTELDAGNIIFVPNAKLDWVTKQEINGDLFKKPLHSHYYISSRFGWRTSPFDSSKRTFHGGIDMAVAKGTAIYPAMNGVVVQKGYNDVYGNYVIISHHSGYKTLYGHMMESACVSKGNFVYTNTKIGKVGSTGMSTGPHLHFTVYKNGRSVNPANLWN